MINRKWMLVDCPGYGDSRGYESSKQERLEWHELTQVWRMGISIRHNVHRIADSFVYESLAAVLSELSCLPSSIHFQEYFLSRKTLAHIFLLIDASSPLSSDDIHAALWWDNHIGLDPHGVPMMHAPLMIVFEPCFYAIVLLFVCSRINDSGRPWSLVFTKLDVVDLSRAHPLDNMEHCLEKIERLTASTPFFIPTSSNTGLGKDPLLKYISSLRQAFKMPLVFK